MSRFHEVNFSKLLGACIAFINHQYVTYYICWSYDLYSREILWWKRAPVELKSSFSLITWVSNYAGRFCRSYNQIFPEVLGCIKNSIVWKILKKIKLKEAPGKVKNNMNVQKKKRIRKTDNRNS